MHKVDQLHGVYTISYNGSHAVGRDKGVGRFPLFGSIFPPLLLSSPMKKDNDDKSNSLTNLMAEVRCETFVEFTSPSCLM